MHFKQNTLRPVADFREQTNQIILEKLINLYIAKYL